MKAMVEEFVTKSANLFIATHRLFSVWQAGWQRAVREYTYILNFLSQHVAKSLLNMWGPLTHGSIKHANATRTDRVGSAVWTSFS